MAATSLTAVTPAVGRRGRLRGRPSGLKGRYHDRYATGLRPALDPGASATPSPRSGTGQGQQPLPAGRSLGAPRLCCSRSNPLQQSLYGSRGLPRAVLNRLWKLVNDRLNYLTPTIKPIGYTSSSNGRRRRLYDAPQTPLQRLLAAGVLSPAQQVELIAYRDSLNPAKIGREIANLQTRLLGLAKEKTEQLYLASIPTALPDVRKGIRTQPA